MARIPKNSVSLAGEFATLSQLIVRGYVATMTLGNTKAIDILVFNPDSGQSYQVEVKTNFQDRNAPTNSRLFGRYVSDWQMNAKHETIVDPNLFYCFVHINSPRNEPSSYNYRFFVVPSSVVAKYVMEENRAWVAAKSGRKSGTRRTFRIGLPNEREIISPAPLASDYEDKWELVTAPSVIVTPDAEETSDQ